MAIDGLFINHLKNELSSSLVGGRLNKIYQVGKLEFLFTFYNNKKKHKLYISISGDRSRCNITEKDFHYPDVAPMWCMILRKHLNNAHLLDISQNEFDRVLTFKFSFTNLIGDTEIKYLTLELMGRHSNMILHNDEKIIDCIKHINYEQRILLPGVKYKFPETNKKIPKDIDKSLSIQELISNYQGVSKVGAMLIKEDPSKINELKPTIFEKGFYFNDIKSMDSKRNYYPSLSLLLDDYFYKKDVQDRIKQTTENLQRFVKRELSKNNKKMINLQRDLSKAEDASQYRLKGELLYANLYKIEKGMENIILHDYEGNEINVKLNKLLTPSQNAKKYFIKYQKAKNGLILIKEQIDKTQEEINYLDSVETMLNNCKLKDALEIKEELTSLGYFRNRSKKNKKTKKKTPAFEKFTSPEGIQILVGKNNVQNDYITFKEASKDDIWMHAKDMPGSHVIIKMSEPTETTIRYAANIAALYSKGKSSSSVPVDYTLVRNVKKVPGKKPGFVIISNQKTIYIDPDENLI